MERVTTQEAFDLCAAAVEEAERKLREPRQAKARQGDIVLVDLDEEEASDASKADESDQGDSGDKSTGSGPDAREGPRAKPKSK